MKDEQAYDRKKYLTISQVAKLRNININSLRYYEKLGVLVPAYVDSESRYRYYRPEQLFTLDIILLCISLDVPLKNLPKYTNSNSILGKKLLEDGRTLAKQKIKDIQLELQKIEYILNRQTENEKYAKKESIYQREFESRYFILERYFGKLNDSTQINNLAATLFSYADKRQMTPILSTGILLKYDKEEIKQFIFYEVLTPVTDDKLICLPTASFQCIHFKLEEETNCLELIEHYFGHLHFQTVILTDFVQNEYVYDNKDREIQVFCEKY